ncbi:MAG: GNAT family N-acetyltransferase [Turicibacter sp.]|nr:GNAT family N-acetyltransferase [Turicibacter sp.]
MMNIRYAVPDDAEAIVAVNREGWQTAYRGILPDEILDSLDMKAPRTRQSITDNPKQTFVFEDENQRIIGFCSFGELRWTEEFSEQCDCELNALYVLSECRGRGVGKALLAAARSEFKAQGKRCLLVNVLEDNAPSVNFYKGQGGKPIGKMDFVIADVAYPQLTFAFRL